MCATNHILNVTLQAGLGVQWRACAQGLTAIASIKRSLSQFASLLAASASRLPATPPTGVSSADAVLTAATTATSAPLPAAVPPPPSPPSTDGDVVPCTPASICDSDADVGGATPVGGDGASAVVGDAFLSQLFGAEEQAMFQQFL